MNKFNLVVPAYNCEAWITKSLFSIKNQIHKNYQCVIYNDASTDNTGLLIDDFMKKHGDERFSVIHNDVNKKALHNIVEGFKKLNSEDEKESVLAVVDGDDYLFCEYSLKLVDQVYSKTNSMLTYGSFVMWPTGELSFDRSFPPEVIKNNSYRNYKFVSSHLRTFKSYLWNSINDEDLRDTNRDYFKVGWDVAFMMPMLEMTGGKFTYIPNILYVYNRWNPISDDVINSSEQIRVDQAIRLKKKYKPL